MVDGVLTVTRSWAPAVLLALFIAFVLLIPPVSAVSPGNPDCLGCIRAAGPPVVVRTIDLDSDGVVASPTAIAYDPSTNQLFAVDYNNPWVWVIQPDSGKVLGMIDESDTQAHETAVVDPLHHLLFVGGDQPGDNIYVIQTTTDSVVETWPYATLMGGLAVDPALSETFIDSIQSNTAIQDELTGQSEGAVQANATVTDGLAFDSANGNLYITYDGSGLGVYDAQSLSLVAWIEDTPWAGSAYQVVVDPASGDVFVSDDSQSVYVLAGKSLSTIRPISVGTQAQGMAYDPNDQVVWVADTGSNQVTAISARTLRSLGSVTVGAYPWDVAYDPADHEAYVTNAQAGTISVLALAPFGHGPTPRVATGSGSTPPYLTPRRSPIR